MEEVKNMPKMSYAQSICIPKLEEYLIADIPKLYAIGR
jgi:hypothetical protein